MVQTTYLITGGNRGLGRALVTALLLRPNTTVIASVRDTTNSTSTSLHSLPIAQGSNLILAKIDASSSTDQASAIATLQSEHKITALDVVLNNAGLIDDCLPVAETSPESLLSHFHVNALSAVLLYQATRPLLLDSKGTPRFIITSGLGGSIGAQDYIRMPLAAYGASRAAVNFLFRKVHFEEERIASVLINPGLIRTDTGNNAAIEKSGIDPSRFQSVESAAAHYLKVVDDTTRETFSGKFISSETQTEEAW